MIDRRAVLAASLAAAFAGRSREALAAAVSPDDGAIELHGRRLEIVRAKRELDRDAQVGPEDLAAWEKKQGGLPAGCCVAMLSGWDPLAEVARYGSLSPEERRKSPGFSRAAADLLLNRDVRGIAVDTLSPDAGRDMPAYPMHQSWLRSGLEAVAHLDRTPASGAVMFVGAPPVAEATAIPVRAVALF